MIRTLAAFEAIISGTAHFRTEGVDEAVAARARILLQGSSKAFAHLDGDYCYDGNRCQPENLGWRFVQFYGAPDPATITAGEFDEQLAATYHDAASAEYYYRYEKDWG